MFAVYRTDAAGVFENDPVVTDTSLAQVTLRVRDLQSTNVVGPRAYLVHLGAGPAAVLARWRPGQEGFWGPVNDRERGAIGEPMLVA